MKKTTLAFSILIVLLVLAGSYFFYEYSTTQKQLADIRKVIDNRNINFKVVDFAEFFTEKVLGAKGDVSLEDRLTLEQKVRDTKDADIFNQWTKFTNSANQNEAQDNVKKLLIILMSKLKNSQ